VQVNSKYCCSNALGRVCADSWGMVSMMAQHDIDLLACVPPELAAAAAVGVLQVCLG
jgi:hypothetical protein